VPNIYPADVQLMTTKQNGLPHVNTLNINGLAKFLLHYKIHSKPGNKKIGPVCRRWNTRNMLQCVSESGHRINQTLTWYWGAR